MDSTGYGIQKRGSDYYLYVCWKGFTFEKQLDPKIVKVTEYSYNIYDEAEKNIIDTGTSEKYSISETAATDLIQAELLTQVTTRTFRDWKTASKVDIITLNSLGV